VATANAKNNASDWTKSGSRFIPENPAIRMPGLSKHPATHPLGLLRKDQEQEHPLGSADIARDRVVAHR